MYRDFYFPDRLKYDTPERAGLAFEKISFKSIDGTQLSGWFIPVKDIASPQQAKGTVIHMHGNAQNMSAHWQFAEWIPNRGYNLFEFDYRGYGQSWGQPEPKGVFEDAVAALNYLRSRTDIDTGKLFVFGQSLGGMISIAAAAESQEGIRAVLAEAPIHSYSILADDRMPGEGGSLDDTYCANTYVAKLSPIPLMLIHGTNDKIVPYSHSVMLLAEAGEPKQLVTIENGEHIDAMTDRYSTKYQDMMIAFFDAAQPES